MVEKAWLEVSLVVDGEMAEAVAEVLARFAPGGVAIETTEIISDPESEGQPSGPLRVAGYLPLNDAVEEKRRRLEEALWHLGQIRALPEAGFKILQEADWTEAWKQHYQPVPIGERLLIVPAWMKPPESKQVVVHINPGMAFGTGTHPSTQLCLEILTSRILPGSPVEAVIDVGCGSGILAVAALKLGARRALGVDVDPQAIEAARENAAFNGVADRLELGVGSLAEIRVGSFNLWRAPLVMANILAPVLVRLLGEGLGELLTPGGCLVLSGILEEQAGEVEKAALENGLQVVEHRIMGDWVALAVERFRV